MYVSMGCPMLFICNKDGSLKMCIEYHQLNKVTMKNKNSHPRIDDLFDQIYGATIFQRLIFDQVITSWRLGWWISLKLLYELDMVTMSS